MADDPAAMRWALERVIEATDVPADKRGDVEHLRSAVILAHAYAKAGLLPAIPPEQPGLFDERAKESA